MLITAPMWLPVVATASAFYFCYMVVWTMVNREILRPERVVVAAAVAPQPAAGRRPAAQSGAL